MQTFFSRLSLRDFHQDVMRNIVSIRESQDLFDDLSIDPADWALAQQVELDTKPMPYRSPEPVIHRPFEEAAWCNAIGWPFGHWQASRYSDGSFGVWYGSESIETTVYETVYHWYHGLLADAGFQHTAVIGERKIYRVACQAVLLDGRRAAAHYPAVLHKSNYAAAQALGARLHREGHPGLLMPSVRRPEGENVIVFNPEVLSDPRFHCALTYRLTDHGVSVEKQPGTTWLNLPAHTW
jgi:hypothetical protein